MSPRSRNATVLAILAALAVVLVVLVILWERQADASLSSDGAAAATGGQPRPRSARAAWTASSALQPTPSSTGGERDEELPLPPRSSADAGADGGPDPAALHAAAQLAVGQWLKRNAELAEKNVDKLCEDSKKLQTVDPLGERPRTHDAATYLAVRVDWEGGRQGLLHLPEALATRLRGFAPGTWVSQLDERDWAGLDFHWMKELDAYDYWSMSADGPMKDPASLDLLEAFQPNYIGLMSWTKLRLASALRTGDLPEASREVRHLADLIGSTGMLLGEMIRLALLRMDRTAWEASGQPVPEASTMTADAMALARKVQFGSTWFLYPGVPRAVREKALACAPARCTALMEALAAAVAFQEFVPAARDDIDWLLAQQPCDGPLAEKAARAAPESPEKLAAFYTDNIGAQQYYP
jgi:hypothetical protein